LIIVDLIIYQVGLGSDEVKKNPVFFFVSLNPARPDHHVRFFGPSLTRHVVGLGQIKHDFLCINFEWVRVLVEKYGPYLVGSGFVSGQKFRPEPSLCIDQVGLGQFFGGSGQIYRIGWPMLKIGCCTVILY